MIILAIICLNLTACNQQTEQQAGGGERPLPEVGVVTIQPKPIELTTELPGRTSAFMVAEIRPQVNGIIEKRLFEEGADVTAGQLLYQIDPAPFQAALDSAVASLGQAEANLPSIKSRAERYNDLLADKAVSQQDYDDAAAAVKQVLAQIEYWKAQVASARINLNYTRVTAPIDGRIGKSSVTSGAMVTAYQPVPLATIQQLDPIYLDVTQSSAELLRFKRGMESGHLENGATTEQYVKIFLEDGTLYPENGMLKFRDVTVNPSTGSYTLRIVVPNADLMLMPGMYAQAVVSEGVVPNAILAPQQAVTRNPKGQAVAYVVDGEDTVQQRILEVDRAVASDWLVKDGLNPGDRVIVEGRLNVRPGAKVRVVAQDLKTAAPEKTEDGGM